MGEVSGTRGGTRPRRQFEIVPAVDVPDAIVDAVCTLRAALRRKELR
ncbi:hypothetical protein [Streptomyces acidicola]